jgi:hypothetical protein
MGKEGARGALGWHLGKPLCGRKEGDGLQASLFGVKHQFHMLTRFTKRRGVTLGNAKSGRVWPVPNGAS